VQLGPNYTTTMFKELIIQREKCQEPVHIAKRTITVDSFLICQAIYECKQLTDNMAADIKSDPACTFKGFKNQMNTCKQTANRSWLDCCTLLKEHTTLVKGVCKETHDYFDKIITKGYFSLANWLGKYKHPTPRLSAHTILTQGIVAQCCTFIDACFVEMVEMKLEIAKLENKNFNSSVYLGRLQCLKQDKLNDRLYDLTMRIQQIYGDVPDGDVNDCQELKITTSAFESQLSDINLFYLHEAFSYQQSYGDQWLHDFDYDSWLLLHPDKDPKVIAKREREAAQAEADRLERERIDRELAEAEAARKAEEERDIADRLIDAGWNINKKTKK